MRGFSRIFLFFALCVFIGVTSVHAAVPLRDMTTAQEAEVHASFTEKGCSGHAQDAVKAKPREAAQHHEGAHSERCDKSMCKCIGGACHNGLSSIIGNGGDWLIMSLASNAQITSADETTDSALSARVKRPPRA